MELTVTYHIPVDFNDIRSDFTIDAASFVGLRVDQEVLLVDAGADLEADGVVVGPVAYVDREPIWRIQASNIRETTRPAFRFDEGGSSGGSSCPLPR